MRAHEFAAQTRKDKTEKAPELSSGACLRPIRPVHSADSGRMVSALPSSEPGLYFGIRTRHHIKF